MQNTSIQNLFTKQTLHKKIYRVILALIKISPRRQGGYDCIMTSTFVINKEIDIIIGLL